MLGPARRSGPALIHREFALHGRDNAPGNVAHVLLDPGRALAPHAVLALGMFDRAADGPALTDVEPGDVLDPLPADALVAVAHERADGLRAAARDRRVALTAVAAALLARPRATLSLLQRDAGPDPAPLLWGVFDLVSHLARGSWSFSTYETSDDAARPRFVVVPRWPDSAPNGRLRLEADTELEQTPYGEAARRLVDFYAERPWTETRAPAARAAPDGVDGAGGTGRGGDSRGTGARRGECAWCRDGCRAAGRGCGRSRGGSRWPRPRGGYRRSGRGPCRGRGRARHRRHRRRGRGRPCPSPGRTPARGTPPRRTPRPARPRAAGDALSPGGLSAERRQGRRSGRGRNRRRP
ncbi:hypothetical protein ACU686_01500 [Yinghuangia aomiensis]